MLFINFVVIPLLFISYAKKSKKKKKGLNVEKKELPDRKKNLHVKKIENVEPE